MTGSAPLRLAIGRITVSAASGLDARRLADALPGALERALASPAPGPGFPSPAEQAAAQIAAAVRERLS